MEGERKTVHLRENSIGNVHFRAACFVELFRLLKRIKDYRYLKMISDFAVAMLSDFSRNLIGPELHQNGLGCVAVKFRNFMCVL